jgi:hypothetical protein
MNDQTPLLFFNKEGDCLNFNYNTTNDRFEGNLMFHESSSDVYKTIGIYLMESIPSFEYENKDLMILNKFQLFNEYGFDFYKGNYTLKQITKIEPSNNRYDFYSKWVYGDSFDIFFPIGTIIKFDSSVLEFSNPNQTYTVINTKKGAFMIISSMDNNTFESTYNAIYDNSSTYTDKTISSVNSIGIYNYIDENYDDNLSLWNEPSFYDKIYKRKKLTIVGSELNDGIYTINNEEFTDNEFFRYSISATSSGLDNDLMIEIITKNDLPMIYDGSLSFKTVDSSYNSISNNIIEFSSDIPKILKPNFEFVVNPSLLNTINFVISDIPSFENIYNISYYGTHSQVLYENKIYQCIKSYTQSFSEETTAFITPLDTEYWTDDITYLPLQQNVKDEVLGNSQLYLTNNKYQFIQKYTATSSVTLASAAEKYANIIKSLNIELYYEFEELKADLMYASDYADIHFYKINGGSPSDLATKTVINERLIGIEEPLTKEMNYNMSSLNSVNIVFTDLDEYGLKISINGQLYDQEISTGTSSEMQDIIEETLLNWIDRNSDELYYLGITSSLVTTESSKYDTIHLSGDYPNVEMIINNVFVGTTADYYIDHSWITFNDMGNYLSLKINDDDYGILVSKTGYTPDISTTLENWVTEYYDYLIEYGIVSNSDGNSLKFGIKDLNRRFEYTISVGKVSLPGELDYEIENKITGNLGVLISSNEILLTDSNTYTFEESGFATGMVISINNSIYSLNNKEYNILFLDPTIINLSYEGPFWGTYSSYDQGSPFKTLSFDYGFYRDLIYSTSSTDDEIGFTSSMHTNIDDNNYGILSSDYIPHTSLWLKSNTYLRKPRENFSYETQVQYYWKWIDDQSSEFFMYDFSGDQLPTGTSYSYIGEKPLTTVVLNKNPNTDITKTSLPEYQQTIFDVIKYDIDYIDDEDNISDNPESLELFLGFKSEEEGFYKTQLQLYKKEDLYVTYSSTEANNLIIDLSTSDEYDTKQGYIKINTQSSETFLGKGLKIGQLITIYIKDTTNTTNQYLSINNGLIVKIKNVFFKTLVVDYLTDTPEFATESSVIENYPSTGIKTYCDVIIKVTDKELALINVYGQTEIEDIRFRTELGNIGKLITSNDVFIFKEYDINEGGVDWRILNKKRKEMLMMKHLIYPYIGAYKSIINAINFFGYNDLQLNEYYRNINPASENFLKLFKQEIPDIFDNSVEGWTENDFINSNFSSRDYDSTNLFNLTYDITDKEGTNVSTYTVDEIIIKLQGLKYWLKNNIIPLTHKIMDITGRSYTKSPITISHTLYDITKIKINQEMTPITFKLNEAYLMPINSGSSVYNCVIDFYSIIEGVGSDDETYNENERPLPYYESNPVLPDYYSIKIRTYKTYKEWYPFTNYSIGDKVMYYQKIYESQIDENVNKNPTKYDNILEWVSGSYYTETNTVKYKGDVFVYKNMIEYISEIPPVIDTNNWLKMNQWKEINYEPVQTINEYRKIPKDYSNSKVLMPFNFTIDTDIDPFISIEVSSDNGYGLLYKDKKNYEIRPPIVISDELTYIDQIGPFIPITPIY